MEHKLCEGYTKLLSSLNMLVDDEGLVSLLPPNRTDPKDALPATVGGSRLVIPSRELRRKGIPDGMIAFHPLSENITRGESDVLKMLRILVHASLHNQLSELLMALMDVAANPKLHKKIPASESGLLVGLQDVDAKTATALQAVIGAARTDSSPNKIISLYLKNGGKVSGQGYNRAAIVRFPIWEEFESGDTVIFDVKMRKKDHRAIERLLDYVLPETRTNKDAYSVGSNDLVAPYFDALVKGYIKLSSDLSAVAARFVKVDKTVFGPLVKDFSWFEDYFDDLGVYKGAIPPLDGNVGKPVKGVSDEPASRPEPIVPKDRIKRTDDRPNATSRDLVDEDDHRIDRERQRHPGRDEPVPAKKGVFHLDDISPRRRNDERPRYDDRRRERYDDDRYEQRPVHGFRQRRDERDDDDRGHRHQGVERTSRGIVMSSVRSGNDRYRGGEFSELVDDGVGRYPGRGGRREQEFGRRGRGRGYQQSGRRGNGGRGGRYF